MATMAHRDYSRAKIVKKKVAAGQTVAVDRLVKLVTDDDTCQHAAAGTDKPVGVVYALGPLAGAAGDWIDVALLGGTGPFAMKVGTGGATRGEHQQAVSDGITDATLVAGGGTLCFTAGIALQSGNAGDIIGVLPVPGIGTEA